MRWFRITIVKDFYDFFCTNVTQRFPVTPDKQLKELLLNNPDAFLLEMQQVISAIVTRFVQKKYLDYGSRDEVISHINEALLGGKLETMQKQFNGNSLVTTYFTRIVTNICIRYGQKEQLRKQRNAPADAGFAVLRSAENPHNTLVLQQELKRFERLLRMYGNKSGRLALMLKIYLSIPVERTDLLAAFGEKANTPVLDEIMSLFGGNKSSTNRTNSEIFEQITPLLNRAEGKSNTPDAVRKWIDSKLGELEVSMNAPPSSSQHNKETILALAEIFFINLQKTEWI